MTGPARKRPAAQRGEETGEPRSKKLAGFWSPFNTWWREQYELSGKRPCKAQICEWHEEHALAAWGQECPSVDEMLIHAKGMRSTEEVRNYFRLYRQQLRSPRQPTPRKGASRSTREPCASSGSDAEAEGLAWRASDPQPATSGHASCSQAEPSLPAPPATSASALANAGAASSHSLLLEALSHTAGSGGGSGGGSAPYQAPAVTTSMGGGSDRTGPHWTWGWGPVPAHWGPLSFGYPRPGVPDGGAPVCPFQHPHGACGGFPGQAATAGGEGDAPLPCQLYPGCGSAYSHHPAQHCGAPPCSFALHPVSSCFPPPCGPSPLCAYAQPPPSSTAQPPRCLDAAAVSGACTQTAPLLEAEVAAGSLGAYEAAKAVASEPCQAADADAAYEALLRELDSGAADAAVVLELQPRASAAAKPQVPRMQPAAVFLTPAPRMPTDSNGIELPPLPPPHVQAQPPWPAGAAGTQPWEEDPGRAWSQWPCAPQSQACPQQPPPEGMEDAMPWVLVEQGGEGGQEEDPAPGTMPDLADLLQVGASEGGVLDGSGVDAEWWALLEQLRA